MYKAAWKLNVFVSLISFREMIKRPNLPDSCTMMTACLAEYFTNIDLWRSCRENTILVQYLNFQACCFQFLNFFRESNSVIFCISKVFAILLSLKEWINVKAWTAVNQICQLEQRFFSCQLTALSNDSREKGNATQSQCRKEPFPILYFKRRGNNRTSNI